MLLFGVEIRAASGGSSNFYAVGGTGQETGGSGTGTASSPCNGCTITNSATSVVFFVGNGITLPSSSGNAGQQITMIASTPETLSRKLPPTTSCLIIGGFDTSPASSLFAATGESSFTTLTVISDGAGHWWVTAYQ